MLSVMAKVCQKMLEMPELKSRLRYEETELFILRVMVAIIILYDHVHPTGAFAKGGLFSKVVLNRNCNYDEACLANYRCHVPHKQK